jgi:hypothetical protein
MKTECFWNPRLYYLLSEYGIEVLAKATFSFIANAIKKW